MISFVIRGGLDGRARASSRRVRGLRLRRVARRRGEPHRAPGDHDARLGAGGAARALGIADGFIRLSCGIEDADDLLADLERGFAAAKRA